MTADRLLVGFILAVILLGGGAGAWLLYALLDLLLNACACRRNRP